MEMWPPGVTGELHNNLSELACSFRRPIFFLGRETGSHTAKHIAFAHWLTLHLQPASTQFCLLHALPSHRQGTVRCVREVRSLRTCQVALHKLLDSPHVCFPGLQKVALTRTGT